MISPQTNLFSKSELDRRLSGNERHPDEKHVLNDTSSLRCLRASADRPCPNFIRPTGKVSDELNTEAMSIVQEAAMGSHARREMRSLLE